MFDIAKTARCMAAEREEFAGHAIKLGHLHWRANDRADCAAAGGAFAERKRMAQGEVRVVGADPRGGDNVLRDARPQAIDKLVESRQELRLRGHGLILEKSARLVSYSIPGERHRQSIVNDLGRDFVIVEPI